jgi:hypothetical protein
LTVDDVNRAASKYLSTDAFEAVVVTAGAAKLAASLKQDRPSPKQYNSQVPPEVLATDKLISTLEIKPTALDVVPVSRVFEK